MIGCGYGNLKAVLISKGFSGKKMNDFAEPTTQISVAFNLFTSH